MLLNDPLPPCERAPSVRSTAIALLLPIALSIPLLAGCSTTRLPPQTAAQQANLTAPCPPVEARPDPFVDPERGAWEARLISQYGDCAEGKRLQVNPASARL